MLWYLRRETDQRLVSLLQAWGRERGRWKGEGKRGVSVQDLPRRVPPLLADLCAMCEVAQVAEHARVLQGALLARLVRLILGVRADKGEDALNQGAGQVEQPVGRRKGWRVRLGEGALMAIVAARAELVVFAGQAQELVLLLVFFPEAEDAHFAKGKLHSEETGRRLGGRVPRGGAVTFRGRVGVVGLGLRGGALAAFLQV